MSVRDQLISAAAEVYARFGFRGATTRRIAAAAGVNEVTLFRHFGSKELLLTETLRHAAAQVPRSLPAEPLDVVRELTAWSETFMRDLSQRAALVRVSMGEADERPELSSVAADVLRPAFDELSSYLHRLQAKRLAGADWDADAAAAMLVGALFTDVLTREVAPEIFPSAQASARIYTGLLSRALRLSGETGDRPRAPLPPSLPDATGA